MPKPATQDRSAAAGNAAAAPPFLAFDPTAFDAVLRGSEDCARTCLAWQQELLRFTTSRLQADAELPLSLARCRDVPDLVALQQRWFTTALQDYASEAGQLLDLAGRAARGGLACWQEVRPEEARESAELVE
ncbi:Phasin protein [Tistlia consotensis]|uniref:Phasin protein n=2 Tax=Tistlia TaxID=1321364 RepID=A0A1Y6CC84_9PROT|nr:Phasin protein [Tistlia consotensis USBA 355]SNR88611.1 Phasin protein [Tistlia consotensis]